MAASEELQTTLIDLGLNRAEAHRVFFAHRHRDLLGRDQESAPFHDTMAEDWASQDQFVGDKVFRGGAKSTTGEESITLGALYGDFFNCIVVGVSESKAAERLSAIRHELKTNELLQGMFGKTAWLKVDTDTEIVLGNDVRVMALGRGQSLRGIKWLDRRPDMVWIDDLEDRQDVATPQARKKVWDWLTRDLLPACDPMGRVRISGTPLHPDCVIERLDRDPEWKIKSIPIYYRDLETGELRASWPARFPIEACLKLEAAYRARGELENFKQEYMVQAENPEEKPFKRDMIKVTPQVRTWHDAYSMTDPARTAKSSSATTGHVVWSWINDKLVVWDAWGKRILPNEIIKEVFDSHATYRTVWCGIEEDGLNEWLMQPFRQEMIRSGTTLPLKAVRAPRDKHAFIRGLQPFFVAKEVEFAKPLRELEEQLLGFPTGVIDVPNALAYALKLRPGAKIYDDFGARHIDEDVRPLPGRPVWFCLNATESLITGIWLQVIDGAVRIIGDVVREGDPAELLSDIIGAAQLDTGKPVRLAAGPRHYDQYRNFGLVQAAKRVPAEVRPGTQPDRGRAVLRRLLQRERQSGPLVLVSTSASWTLNAFVGGYSRVRLGGGVLDDKAEEGVYKVLMEGLESFIGVLETGSPEREDDGRQYSLTPDGRQYVSLVAHRRGR